jgi:hypothetical protein
MKKKKQRSTISWHCPIMFYAAQSYRELQLVEESCRLLAVQCISSYVSQCLYSNCAKGSLFFGGGGAGYYYCISSELFVIIFQKNKAWSCYLSATFQISFPFHPMHCLLCKIGCAKLNLHKRRMPFLRPVRQHIRKTDRNKNKWIRQQFAKYRTQWNCLKS